MTVRRGEAWGEVRALPDGTVIVHSDAEARAVVEAARRADRPVPPLGLAGGDLARTLGARDGGPRLRTAAAAQAAATSAATSAAAMTAASDIGTAGSTHEAVDVMVAPVDLGSVLVDGRKHWFVAHAVARRSWWYGRVVAAMNAEFRGDWDVAPRSHPDDGRLDVLDVDARLGLTDRVKARRRLPSGTHVPHPLVRVQRAKAVQFEFERPVPVWLDGERVGEARHLSLRVEPDALICAV